MGDCTGALPSSGALAALVALLLAAACHGGVAAPAKEDRQKPKLGIGFLWTPRSEGAAGKLSSETDFVDLILGGGKLDVFEKVKPPMRVLCLARSLERNNTRPFPGVKETIELLQGAGIKPDRVVIGYNPERQPGTPTREMDSLVESIRAARKLAQAYGAPLLAGPGLRDMDGREHLYPDLSKECDIWLIQSQRLQLSPETRQPFPPAEYREKVKRIVDALRGGNPKVRIYVQVFASGRRDETLFTAEQVVAYVRAIEDLVDAVGIYGGSGELQGQVIDELRKGGPAGARWRHARRVVARRRLTPCASHPGSLLAAIAAAGLPGKGQTMTTRVRADGKIRMPGALVKRYALRPGTQVRLIETRAGILLVPLTDQPMSRELAAELDAWGSRTREGLSHCPNEDPEPPDLSS